MSSALRDEFRRFQRCEPEPRGQISLAVQGRMSVWQRLCFVNSRVSGFPIKSACHVTFSGSLLKTSLPPFPVLPNIGRLLQPFCCYPGTRSGGLRWIISVHRRMPQAGRRRKHCPHSENSMLVVTIKLRLVAHRHDLKSSFAAFGWRGGM